ncbi:MAG: 3-hydroxyacyl-ACP dehydratase FabZ [Candidatus Izemoplasmatales bacterium]|uniref:3-hydroxyacyl-[acyl-carrier-protein] dehydratase FabZ n=1 Tax=Hujiaoplasma nucleasis TaxID=2725268 RepID=A0A7L6N6B3_9MOLU|nr:3-hydroxyacyl-ACP dehydratase FabZ [Hujiaoplasma nucleasis]QLY40788.1 3-hydroxyacyl-ACP dehydratase FabZ [Hujiaoplasma nucleasis]
MELNSNQIQEIIPHRYPFLLVDRIIDLKPGESAVGIKNVSANEHIFTGHFPQEHIMPGVLIVEALAQTGAVTILSMEEHKNKIAYFAGIDQCKFKQKVIPGDQLKLDSRVIKRKGALGIAECIATVNDVIVCKAIIKFAIG